MHKLLLTVPQTTRICSLSRRTIWKYVKSGDLKAFMTPADHYRIHGTALEDLMQWNKMRILA